MRQESKGNTKRRIEEEVLNKVAREVIHVKNLRETIKLYASHINEINKLKKKVRNDELLQVYSKVFSEINLTIYKVSENNKNSFVENSMAMMGFDKEVEIIRKEDAYLCLKTKMIEKVQIAYGNNKILEQFRRRNFTNFCEFKYQN